MVMMAEHLEAPYFDALAVHSQAAVDFALAD